MGLVLGTKKKNGKTKCFDLKMSFGLRSNGANRMFALDLMNSMHRKRWPFTSGVQYHSIFFLHANLLGTSRQCKRPNNALGFSKLGCGCGFKGHIELYWVLLFGHFMQISIKSDRCKCRRCGICKAVTVKEKLLQYFAAKQEKHFNTGFPRQLENTPAVQQTRWQL